MRIVCGTEEIMNIDELQSRANQAAPPVVTDSPIQGAVGHAVAWAYAWVQKTHPPNVTPHDREHKHGVAPSSHKLRELIHIVRSDTTPPPDSLQLFHGAQPNELLQKTPVAHL